MFFVSIYVVIDMNMIPVDLLMLLAGRISYQTCSNLLSI